MAKIIQKGNRFAVVPSRAPKMVPNPRKGQQGQPDEIPARGQPPVEYANFETQAEANQELKKVQFRAAFTQIQKAKFQG